MKIDKIGDVDIDMMGELTPIQYSSGVFQFQVHDNAELKAYRTGTVCLICRRGNLTDEYWGSATAQELEVLAELYMKGV